MVLRCCVPGCQNKGRFGFHKFPRDFENCIKWQCATKTNHLSTESLPYSSLRVCEKHFKDDDYTKSLGKKRLNKISVPTVLVPEIESVGDSVVQELQKRTQELTVVEIVVPNTRESPLPNDSAKKKVGEAAACLDDNGPETVSDSDVNADQESHEETVRRTVLSKSKSKNKRNEEQHVLRQLRYKDTRIKTLRKQLQESYNFGKEKIITYLSKRFNINQMKFFEMQLRNAGKKNHGQRYTNEEKSMMLAIYKRGPRAYRYLSLLFGLPNRRTLCRHSAQVKFDTGINPKLFDLLKSTASKLSDLDRLCTVGWDEMALSHHLSYCDSEDFIDGFVDFGDEQIPDFATHSLTFMIRGVNRSYKQPVAYFFSQNLTGIELAELIILVVRAVTKTGLKIIGSVCDQTGIMAAAVHRLINPNLQSMKQTGMLLTYNVDGVKIIHCYDPPHILKTIRNNLLTKNLRHFVTQFYDPNIELAEYEDTIEAVADWNDIRDFYKFDCENTVRLLPKVTKNHIECEKEKMKVSNAAQIFSKSFGTMMLFCSEKKLIEKDCSGTAYILLFVNNLFDSLNGGGKPVANTFRGPINEGNKKKYFKFWEYAILSLEKMDFIDKDSEATNNRSSVILKTISTIKGYMELTKICLSLGVKSVALRQMNQDGLENFFGSVRAVCHNSKTPIPPQYRSGYTTLILTHLSSKHSIAGNCEEDDNTSLLKNVTALYEEISMVKELDTAPVECVEFNAESVIDLEVSIDENAELQFIDNQALVFESSKICRSITTSNKCESCKSTLEVDSQLKEHDLIKFNDSDIPFLSYPSLLFMSRFKLIFLTVEAILPFICHEKNLLRKLIASLEKIDFDGIGCEEHQVVVVLKMKKATAKLCISNFIKQIDGILSKRMIEPKSDQSVIHSKAFDIVRTKKGIGKNGQQMIL